MAGKNLAHHTHKSQGYTFDPKEFIRRGDLARPNHAPWRGADGARRSVSAFADIDLVGLVDEVGPPLPVAGHMTEEVDGLVSNVHRLVGNPLVLDHGQSDS